MKSNPPADHILERAIDLLEGDLLSFLESTCGGDTDLRSEVRGLLAAHVASGDFLGEPAAPVVFETPPGDGPGARGPDAEPTRVGSYRILRPLGQGGMGAVYIASRDDDEYEREVAIKLIQRGLDGPEARRRFRQERQILASLQHPSITQLFDGGTTETGQPYLVMEVVSGLPLLEHCDRRRLPIEGRLALFQQVCGAVSYAHSCLVIHRDLKPSNILVTADGVPKLLDFGIAKVFEDGEDVDLTGGGSSPRTPAYSSPEQVREDAVTTASDVYSLGLLLYELLCGRRPYRLESKRKAELEEAILHQRPEPPSVALSRPDAEP
ncbi:MAG: serine/threonine-protein kinase, partial [Acidobacteriota bacterium]